MTTPALYVVFATDRPGALALRVATRPSHRAYLRQLHPEGVVVVLGGPTLADEPGDDAAAAPMNGTLLVVRAPSREAVERLVAADPYSQAQLFAEVTIRRWDCSLALPERLAE